MHGEGEGHGISELKSTKKRSYSFYSKKIKQPLDRGKTFVLIRACLSQMGGRRGRELGPTPSIFSTLQISVFLSQLEFQ